MSAWGKFLYPFTVPTGGWNFAWNDGSAQSVTVPAASYATILEFAAALETAIQAVTAMSAVDISEAGISRIAINGMTASDWANTTDALSSALGYDETETVSNPGTATALINSSTQHDHGWYPGMLTFYDYGSGIEDDSGWMPGEHGVQSISGSGKMRGVGPTRFQYTRRLRFGMIRRREIFNRDKGIVPMLDKHRYSTIRWYPDRADGEVGTVGTQGDPGYSSYHLDADCDYYDVTIIDQVRLDSVSNHPDFFRITLELNAEPA